MGVRTRPLGLLADVHANLQALDAALAWLEERGAEPICCLGDVVGYGGDPAACVERIRETCAATVRGNHDAAVVDPALREWFNPHARAAIERQAELLDDDAMGWLASLPATVEGEESGVWLAHSGFADPDAFEYVTGARAAGVELDALAERGARWGFLGHTHVRSGWRRDGGGVETLRLPADGEVDLDGEGPYLVNPGAVGQPRDRDPRAAVAAFDPDHARLSLARLEYDLEGAQRAIRESGMPDFEARRLASGR